MKSFLADRPRVATPTIQASSPAVPASFTPASVASVRHAHAHGSPSVGGAAGVGGAKAQGSAGVEGATRVECVREGDRITRLVVTCACGERIEIDCLYAAGA